MDIRNFFYSLCQKALEIGDSIEFAGVVNADGKLIVGKNKYHPFNHENSLLNKDFFKNLLCSSCNLLVTDDCSCNSSIDYKDTVFHFKIFEMSDFQFVCTDENKFIAFAPLTEEHDKFLCIYFKRSSHINYIVSKINTIFEYNE